MLKLPDFNMFSMAYIINNRNNRKTCEMLAEFKISCLNGILHSPSLFKNLQLPVHDIHNDPWHDPMISCLRSMINDRSFTVAASQKDLNHEQHFKNVLSYNITMTTMISVNDL